VLISLKECLGNYLIENERATLTLLM